MHCSRGEITLILDDSEFTLRAGDVVVQRDHAGANRGAVPARAALFLVDGEFDDSLRQILPSGAVDGLMHGGPHD